MFEFGSRPLVIGHRGARGLYPENTLDGFSRSIALGVEAIELDVAVTSDRILVVTHDLRLNPDIVRGADGRWLEPPTPRVLDLRFDQLRRYDVGRLRPGSAYNECFPEQQPANGVRIPSLREVLSLDPRLLLLIEMKMSPAEPDLTVSPSEMAELVADAVNASGAVSRSMILSFDWRGLRHLREYYPGLATGWLTQQMDDAERRLWWGDHLGGRCGHSAAQVIAEQGGCCWLPEFAEVRKPDIAAAQRLGLRVIPWIVEHHGDLARAFDWDVDGLITDRPDLALETRAAREHSAGPDGR